MTIDLNEPKQTISEKAITVWRINNFLKNSIALLFLCILLFLYYKFSWLFWIGVIVYVMISFVLLMMIYDLSIHPIYLQRTWRYDINEHVIQLKYGFFHKHHIIIPMSRVEYVNTHQGPLLRRYHLSAITIGTITSQHEIPALKEDEAKQLRNKIITLAQIEAHKENDQLTNNMSTNNEHNGRLQHNAQHDEHDHKQLQHIIVENNEEQNDSSRTNDDLDERHKNGG